MLSRSFHFIPAHKFELLNKIKELNSDHFILDLEDGVPSDFKNVARENIKKLNLKNKKGNFWVRINDINSIHFKNDIELILGLSNIGVVIPKYELDLSIYQDLSKYRKILLIEDLKSLIHLSDISTENNIFGFGLGLEDILSEFPRKNSTLGALINNIKLNFVQAVKSRKLVVIDGVFTDYKNISELRIDCTNSQSFGFDGKFCIHPLQIPIINEVFAIPDDEIQWAKKIISLCNIEDSPGYKIINGILVTPPKLLKAKTILNLIGD